MSHLHLVSFFMNLSIFSSSLFSVWLFTKKINEEMKTSLFKMCFLFSLLSCICLELEAWKLMSKVVQLGNKILFTEGECINKAGSVCAQMWQFFNKQNKAFRHDSRFNARHRVTTNSSLPFLFSPRSEFQRNCMSIMQEHVKNLLNFLLRLDDKESRVVLLLYMIWRYTVIKIIESHTNHIFFMMLRH